MNTNRRISMTRLLPLCVCAALGAQTARAATEVLACDMDGDGRYSMSDLDAIHDACQSIGLVPTADSLTCDMNEDGRYSLADLPAIHQFCQTPSPLAGLPLNDTGIDWCASETENVLPCPVDGFPEQDGEIGRDETRDIDRNGHAGFSFTKLDANGNALPASATDWSCVRDNVTGLTWEVKTVDDGLRNMHWTYSWYNPDPATNGGDAGTPDGGNCVGGIDCDTDAYVQAVNELDLCDARDWRLPRRSELISIVNYGRSEPAIDTHYFPETPLGSYWSSSPDANHSDSAWYVFFGVGYVYYGNKDDAAYVRLVRGGQ